MDTKLSVTLGIILFIVIIFGSMRQYRIKNIKDIEGMTGGRRHRSSHSHRHSSHSRHRPSRHRPSSHHHRPSSHGSHHIKYVGRPNNRYYGDPYIGYNNWGMYRRGWPYWLQWNYWWPSEYNCIDYASDRCIGTPDYQSCFNIEYRNCPYM